MAQQWSKSLLATATRLHRRLVEGMCEQSSNSLRLSTHSSLRRAPDFALDVDVAPAPRPPVVVVVVAAVAVDVVAVYNAIV